MQDRTYTFKYIHVCSMCGANQSHFKILGKRLNQSQGRKPKKKIGITTTIVKCKNCGLIFSNPLPIPKSVQDHYGTPPEEYWSKEYLSIDENFFSREIHWLKQLIDFKPGIKVLDIGAGTGQCMIALEKHGCISYGIEPSEPFYKKCVENSGINAERLTMKTIEESSYPENFFDFITFGAVLEHIYDPSEAIHKATSWLKPNGVIHIEVPSSDWLVNKIINLFYKLTCSDYVGNLSPMHMPYHLYEFSLKSFQEHSRKSSYKIADFRYFVCTTHLPKIIDFFIKPYMKWTNTGLQLTIWLRKK